jgi:uncharacterized protein
MTGPSANPVTVVLSRHVGSAHIPAFDAALQALMDAARKKGGVAADVLRGPPGPGGRNYHIIYRFPDEASLRAWDTSSERQLLAARAEALATGVARHEFTGLEAWFDIPAGSSPPSRHRMAVLTWVGIWPLVSLALWLVVPLYGGLPFLARTALTSVLLVGAMTYLVMPFLTKKAERWVYRPDATLQNSP